jgi:hypothetical protein
MINHPWTSGIADFTADREFHPALKIINIKERNLLYYNLFDLVPRICFYLYDIAALWQERKINMVFHIVSCSLVYLMVNRMTLHVGNHYVGSLVSKVTDRKIKGTIRRVRLNCDAQVSGQRISYTGTGIEHDMDGVADTGMARQL